MSDTLTHTSRDVPRTDPGRGVRASLTAAKPLSPFAVLLHTLAAHITAHDLPPADLMVSDSGVVVDLSPAAPLAVNGIRRWAASVQAPVHETPDSLHGQPARLFEARGLTDTGVYLLITAKIHTTAARATA